MANTPEHQTLICLFHHTDRAERTVQELLEIGIPQSAITLLGHAREIADIDTGTASLNTLHVPEADRQRLSDGLRAGGSIVAVSTDRSIAGKVEDIFKEYSADKIDEKVMSTTDSETLGTGATVDASAFPTTLVDERVDLPPVDRAVTMNPPVIETLSSNDLRSFSTLGRSTYTGGPVDEILLVRQPAAALMGSPEIINTEETLILLEPTDLVEETDLVEPRGGSSTAAGMTNRFDPDAPIDNVRNPAADRLNDPLNRR